jgi:glutamine amidotransferase PdxT
MKIGSLALQGIFIIEHIRIMQQLRVEASPIRLPNYLDGLAALVISDGKHIHDLDFSKWM